MSKVICKGKYTSDVGYFLRAVEYGGEKIHTQKIHFTDGRVEDIQDDTKIDFSKYDINKIKKISFILKDSKKPITMSVEKYMEKITQAKAPIKSADVLDGKFIEDSKGGSYETDVEFLGYLDYTANRLGVEKESGTGLFGVGGNVSMEVAAKATQEAYQNGVRTFWMNIVSISREDGDRLGFNTRIAWKDLIISKAPEIAKAYNIPIENFKMYVGFHTNHQNSYHIHLNFYSTSPKDGYIKNGAEGGFEAASEKIKSIVINTIFQDDVADIKKAINLQRNDIRLSLSRALSDEYISDSLNNSFLSLAKDLTQYTSGKMEYGYLNATTKHLVTEVLKDITENSADFKALTRAYFKSCERQVLLYNDTQKKVQQRMEKIKSNFFSPSHQKNDSTALHNMIIRFAKEYNAEAFPSEQRATKEKLEFYQLPQKSASENYLQNGDFLKFHEEEAIAKKAYFQIDSTDKNNKNISLSYEKGYEREGKASQSLPISKTIIQATKKKIIIRAMCRSFAQIIYDISQANEQKTNKKHKNDEELSKQQGAFSSRRGNLSENLF